MQKNILKTFLQDIAVVLCKKRLEKTANIWKMRPFWKLPKMATTLGQKLKMQKIVLEPLLQHIAVVLC